MPEHNELTGDQLHVPGAHTHVPADVTGGIQYRDVQLTDAQIKALPTTPVELVPAPGAGVWRLPIQAYLVCDMPETAYGGLDAQCSLIISPNPAGVAAAITWSEPNYVAQLLTSAGDPSFAFGTLDTGPLTTPFAGPTNLSDGANQPYYDNRPLVIYASNGTAGDLTDGDPANTLSIRVWYAVVPAGPFGA